MPLEACIVRLAANSSAGVFCGVMFLSASIRSMAPQSAFSTLA